MTSRLPGTLRDAASLVKVNVSLAAALAGFLGHTAAAGGLTGVTAMTALGIFCYAGGAAAANTLQDRYLDGAMARTMNRPVPAGRITTRGAAMTALALMALGTLVIARYAALSAVAASLVTVILYNGLYTPLKTRTQWALVPGILSGLMPPVIGWLAAGGMFPSAGLGYLAVLYGTWQLPHFWLIVMERGDEYRRCGIPTILDRIPPERLRSITFIWIAAFAVLSLYSPLFGVTSLLPASVVLAVNALVLTLRAANALLSRPGLPIGRGLAAHLTLSLLVLTGAVVVDVLLR